MANNILNPLEKELLIRLYRKSPGVRIADFCRADNVSTAAFQTWLKRYDAKGLAGLCRSKKTPSILPEGVAKTEENLRRELIRTRIELERLKRLHPNPERRWEPGRFVSLSALLVAGLQDPRRVLRGLHGRRGRPGRHLRGQGAGRDAEVREGEAEAGGGVCEKQCGRDERREASMRGVSAGRPRKASHASTKPRPIPRQVSAPIWET